MLGTFGVEATAFGWRASHGECPGRYTDHDRTLWAFLKFSIFLILGEARAGREQCKHHDKERWKKSSWHRIASQDIGSVALLADGLHMSSDRPGRKRAPPAALLA
jgi:hypothetical protein